jgi:tetratricopeptide (TPR) repeat protein
MRITSPYLKAAHLTRNEEIALRCQTAFDLRSVGDHYEALQVMRPLWKAVGHRPQTKDLPNPVAAELLLCSGILTSWISSMHPNRGGQQTAKELITDSIGLYQSMGDAKKVAAARIELSISHWYTGNISDARNELVSALQTLTTQGRTRARAIVQLSIVEWLAMRYETALEILEDNASLFRKINDHLLKANYRMQLGIVLHGLAESHRKQDLSLRALDEYNEANRELQLTRNVFFKVSLKNNVANVLRQLGRFSEAHKYLDEAREFASRMRDRMRVIQIDETRVQVLLAQGKPSEG